MLTYSEILSTFLFAIPFKGENFAQSVKFSTVCFWLSMLHSLLSWDWTALKHSLKFLLETTSNARPRFKFKSSINALSIN